MMLQCALKLLEMGTLPLTKRVVFKTKLQQGNRIQIPRLLRWEFKLESDQVLGVAVHFEGEWSSLEKFYAQMSKDGRITVPKLTCSLLKNAYRGQDIVGAIFEVDLTPSEGVLEEQDEEDE